MGVTKYPIMDEGFALKVLGACKDVEERGLVKLLMLTGMHISVITGVDFISKKKSTFGQRIVRPPLSSSDVIKQGSQYIVRWIRPKTTKTLEHYIPKADIEDIKAFLEMKHKTRQHYFNMVKAIGERAGYDSVSPMTFRHNRCIRALTIENRQIWEIPHVMGCTLEVASRNYSKKRDLEQVQGENELGK